jgi:hypothetical protein
VIAPRLGAKKNGKQAKATSLFTANQAIRGAGGAGGAAGTATAGPGGSPGGTPGYTFPGTPGAQGSPGTGSGGGLFLDPAGTATIKDTTITGNQASTSNNDVAGAFQS